MKRLIFPTLVVLLPALLAHAASPATTPATAAQPALLAIRYQRTSGFAGTNDIIEITSDGTVTASGKLIGAVKGQLTASQIAALAALFKDWDSLQPKYPAAPGGTDGFETTIRYGSKQVSASEPSAGIPASFAEIRKALEKIAADMKAK